MQINKTDVLAHEISTAIHKGNVETLKQLLQDNPGLATARIVDNKGCERTLLHVAADWPGHFPNIRETIRAIIEAGAEPSPSFIGGNGHAETPLHGAASSDDVDAIDALLDGGADIEAPGAIFTGGTAMSDAVVFANYNAARRLVERGAQTTIWQAAALGLFDRVEKYFAAETPPDEREITGAFWHACRGGQQPTVEYLLERGAEINWLPPWDKVTPLHAAKQSGNENLVQWLESKGAKMATELT